METFNVYRTTKSITVQRSTFEAETREEALKMAEEDTEEKQVHDWKDEYDESIGWTHTINGYSIL